MLTLHGLLHATPACLARGVGGDGGAGPDGHRPADVDDHGHRDVWSEPERSQPRRIGIAVRTAVRRLGLREDLDPPVNGVDSSDDVLDVGETYLLDDPDAAGAVLVVGTDPEPEPRRVESEPEHAAAVLDPPPPPVSTSGAPFLPYSDGSFFTSSLAGAPVDNAATAQFRAFMASHPEQAGTGYPVIRGVDGNQWGVVYAEGHSSDPVWRLASAVPGEVSALRTTGFHAPEWFGSLLTGTSDSPFVVMDRASGITVWGAKASVAGSHVVNVGAAGMFEHASNGLDGRNPRSDSTANFRSRGAIPDAMVIRHDLLARAAATGGDLGHVLHMFFVETDSAAGFVHPMVGAESGKSGWGAEGQRIAVRSDADLSGCSPEAAVIARTLQRHGAYLGDNAGSQTSLKAEQESAGHHVWGGTLHADELKGCISWADFVVISPGYQ